MLPVAHPIGVALLLLIIWIPHYPLTHPSSNLLHDPTGSKGQPVCTFSPPGGAASVCPTKLPQVRYTPSGLQITSTGPVLEYASACWLWHQLLYLSEWARHVTVIALGALVVVEAKLNRKIGAYERITELFLIVTMPVAVYISFYYSSVESMWTAQLNSLGVL